MSSTVILYFVFLCIALFFCSLFLTKLYIKFTYKHKLVAIPNDRSLHKTPTPTGGGVVFSLSHMFFLLLSLFLIDDLVVRDSIIKLCLGGVLVLILGILDDRFNLKAKHKLLFQTLIAVLMLALGFNISQLTNPLGGTLLLGHLSAPVTILWYLLVMNAINLIDGLDGLAAGITIITCTFLLFFSYHNRNFLVFLNCSYLIVALLAFLKYNYSPAKIFMGDTGSLFLGFLISSLSIAGNETQFKGLTTFTLLIPMTVIFIPLGDTLLTIIRRLISRQYIFKADKNHIHHKLLDIGFSHKTVTLICWFITFMFGLIALGYIFISRQIMLLVLLLVSLIMITLFIYIYKKEFFK